MYQGPGEDFSVVGGEGVAAAVKQSIVGVGVLVVLLQLYLRMILFKIGFCGRAFGDDERLAVKLLHVGNNGGLRRNDAKRNLHVRQCKVNFFCTVFRYREVGKNNVHFVSDQEFNTACRVDGDVFHFNAEVLGETVAEVDVIAAYFPGSQRSRTEPCRKRRR